MTYLLINAFQDNKEEKLSENCLPAVMNRGKRRIFMGKKGKVCRLASENLANPSD